MTPGAPNAARSGTLCHGSRLSRLSVRVDASVCRILSQVAAAVVAAAVVAAVVAHGAVAVVIVTASEGRAALSRRVMLRSS